LYRVFACPFSPRPAEWINLRAWGRGFDACPTLAVRVDLVKRLEKHGFTETEASITNKPKRGTFSATFFLACIAALELERVVLEEI
jgi:Domain of unknown function (DUF6471)